MDGKCGMVEGEFIEYCCLPLQNVNAPGNSIPRFGGGVPITCESNNKRLTRH